MEYVFIINPISGKNRNPQKLEQWIREIFQPFTGRFEIRKTRYKGHATEIARQCAAEGSRMVIAVGGDGTINEIARGLVYSSTALGVVPAGSGNGFARNMGIPLNQREAIRALLQPAFRKIDVGKLNGHYFINVAGMGLDATIAWNFEQFGMRGPLPYFIVGVREYFKFKPERIVLELDGQHLERTPLLLSIANAPQYGNGAIIAPGAVPDDGQMELCILNPISLGKTLLNLHRLFNATINVLEEMEIFPVRRLKIQRERYRAIHTDGDPYEDDLDLQFEVLPRALEVVIPRLPFKH